MPTEIETLLRQRLSGSSIDSTIHGVIETGMNSIGSGIGLHPLDWQFTRRDGGAIEGMPQELCSDATKAIEEWAAALGFTEYTFNVGDGSRSWYLATRDWHIEISNVRSTPWMEG